MRVTNKTDRFSAINKILLGVVFRIHSHSHNYSYVKIVKQKCNELTVLFLFIPDIIIPGFWSKECALLFLIAGTLIARSVSDVWLIQTITMIEGAVVTMDKTRFRSNILRYFSALPLVKNSIYPSMHKIYVNFHFFFSSSTDCRYK